MTEKQDGNSKRQIGIMIDYENIDVSDIMKQVKEKIAAGQGEEQDREQAEEKASLTSDQSKSELQDVPSEGSKFKRILLKIMRPFSPLIKFLVLPVHQEVLDTVQQLHQTNQRLDVLDERVIKLGQTMGDVKAYTMLLHNLTHNLVVELTKLKIEEEGLKVKTRIIEKDFEFLRRREKALEQQVFK